MCPQKPTASLRVVEPKLGTVAQGLEKERQDLAEQLMSNPVILL